MKPLAIDLFCGLGGWTEGLLLEGYDVVGFDIERHDYGDGMRYPAQLVLQDVATIVGRQFKDAALIVASPPCQAYSYRAMPWKRAKALPPPSNDLFDACFRIQREAIEAAGRFIPLVVENVRGAQPWVGRSRWNYGSFHLWGDVPALMPMDKAIKNGGGSWLNVAHNTASGNGNNPDGRKVPGFRFDGSGRSFQIESVKVSGMDWSKYGTPGYKAVAFNGEAARRLRDTGLKVGGDWFSDPLSPSRTSGSKSKARKAAAAAIAKIPLPLSQHIARYWYPREVAAA